MPLLCSGRPVAGQACGDESAAKPGFLAAVASVRNFLRERQPSAAPKLGDVRANVLQRRRVDVAERYMSARLAGRRDEVLSLVTDDVLLESSRDGKVAGKDQFRSYIARVKPTGTWKRARWNSAIGKAEILGNVRILMVNVSVIAHFGFDRSGKINRIYVGTKRKSPQ